MKIGKEVKKVGFFCGIPLDLFFASFGIFSGVPVWGHFFSLDFCVQAGYSRKQLELIDVKNVKVLKK